MVPPVLAVLSVGAVTGLVIAACKVNAPPRACKNCRSRTCAHSKSPVSARSDAPTATAEVASHNLAASGSVLSTKRAVYGATGQSIQYSDDEKDQLKK